jgi:hypothetical protein
VPTGYSDPGTGFPVPNLLNSGTFALSDTKP